MCTQSTLIEVLVIVVERTIMTYRDRGAHWRTHAENAKERQRKGFLWGTTISGRERKIGFAIRENPFHKTTSALFFHSRLLEPMGRSRLPEASGSGHAPTRRMLGQSSSYLPPGLFARYRLCLFFIILQPGTSLAHLLRCQYIPVFLLCDAVESNRGSQICLMGSAAGRSRIKAPEIGCLITIGV